MNCEQSRELASARIDGALSAVESTDLDRHLAGCAACRHFVEGAHRLRRDLLTEAVPPPDLVGSIMARVVDVPQRRWFRVQWVLLVIAALEVLLAVQSLTMAEHHGHEMHRHSAFMYLALAVGFLIASRRPSQTIAGVLPMTIVLLACLLASAAIEVSSGATSGLGALVHLVCVAGVLTSWALARAVVRPGARFA